MSANSKRTHLSFFAIAWGCIGLLGTLLWAGAMAPPDDPDVDAVWAWGALLALMVTPLLHTAVHELGHLLAARCLGLRVVGVRIWWLLWGSRRKLPNTNGHVAVDLVGAPSPVRTRMIVFALAGPAANVAGAALATAALVANASAPPWLRAAGVGFAATGFLDALVNLTPRRITDEVDTDGRRALLWLFRARDQHQRHVLRVDLARVAATSASSQRDDLVAAVDDPRPAMSVAAMSELLRRRPRYDDGWQDYEVVARFAVRADVPGEARATIAGNYSLSLALSYLGSLGAGESTDPVSPTVSRIEQLAGVALAADRGSLAARTGLGLVRVLQDRPAEARALLVDVHPGASLPAQARAHAVRGIAEAELGDVSQAVSLGLVARRQSPGEPLLAVLDAVVASRSGQV